MLSSIKVLKRFPQLAAELLKPFEEGSLRNVKLAARSIMADTKDFAQSSAVSSPTQTHPTIQFDLEAGEIPSKSNYAS